MAQFTDTIKEVLKEKENIGESPIVVIIDFTLVVGMDSSAAHAVAKLKKILHRFFHVEVSIFVTGSDRGGFPCEYALSHALSSEPESVKEAGVDWNDIMESSKAGCKGSRAAVKRGSISISPGTPAMLASRNLQPLGRVCESVDQALIFAEDVLVAREDHTFRDNGEGTNEEDNPVSMTLDEEKMFAKKILIQLCADNPLENIEASVNTILSLCKREVYAENDVIWKQGSTGDCVKLVVSGRLTSYTEDASILEEVKKGNVVGELGLLHGTRRFTTLICSSRRSVLYSLDREAWKQLNRDDPGATTVLYIVSISYLAHRVQHVSNRYFGGTLPV